MKQIDTKEDQTLLLRTGMKYTYAGIISVFG